MEDLSFVDHDLDPDHSSQYNEFVADSFSFGVEREIKGNDPTDASDPLTLLKLDGLGDDQEPEHGVMDLPQADQIYFDGVLVSSAKGDVRSVSDTIMKCDVDIRCDLYASKAAQGASTLGDVVV